MKIDFKWIGAATWTLEFSGIKIACDPCLAPRGSKFDFTFFKSERIVNPEYEISDFSNVDVWFITHSHDDHIDNLGAEVIEASSTIITRKNAVKKLRKNGLNKFNVLDWSDEFKIQKAGIEIDIIAVPAIHGSNVMSSFFAGSVNGYWIKLTTQKESKAIYITGDTINHRKVKHQIGNQLCDVLIPNMGAVLQSSFGGPLTLNNAMLTQMIKWYEPQVVLPVHYGCFSHYSNEEPKISSSRYFPEIHHLKRGVSLEINI